MCKSKCEETLLSIRNLKPLVKDDQKIVLQCSTHTFKLYISELAFVFCHNSIIFKIQEKFIYFFICKTEFYYSLKIITIFNLHIIKIYLKLTKIKIRTHNHSHHKTRKHTPQSLTVLG